MTDYAVAQEYSARGRLTGKTWDNFYVNDGDVTLSMSSLDKIITSNYSWTSDPNYGDMTRGFFRIDGVSIVGFAGGTVRLKELQHGNDAFVAAEFVLGLYGFSSTPGNPIVLDDWWKAGTTLLSDTTYAYSTISTDLILEFPLNAAGLAYVIANAPTVSFAMRWARDVAGSAPTWPEQYDTINVNLSGTEEAGLGLITNVSTLEVQTDAATSITGTSATLNGTLIDDSSDTPVMCSFEWGLTTAYGNTTLPEVVAESASYSKVIGNNLTPGTTYHFRAKAVGASSYTVYGDDMTFNSSPTASQMRVTGLVHYFKAGPSPVYQLEIIRGGLGGSTYLPPVFPSAPIATEQETKTTKEYNITSKTLTINDYGKWLQQHNPSEIKQIFGHQPTFSEWAMWYSGGGMNYKSPIKSNPVFFNW
jgi:hypothetical protein